MCVHNARFHSYSGTLDGESYFTGEAGDDVWDVINYNETAEWLGTCMDVYYAYHHTGCPAPSSSGVMVSIMGCTGKLGWGQARAATRLV